MCLAPPIYAKDGAKLMSRKLYGVPPSYSNRNDRIVVICSRVRPHL